MMKIKDSYRELFQIYSQSKLKCIAYGVVAVLALV